MTTATAQKEQELITAITAVSSRVNAVLLEMLGTALSELDSAVASGSVDGIICGGTRVTWIVEHITKGCVSVARSAVEADGYDLFCPRVDALVEAAEAEAAAEFTARSEAIRADLMALEPSVLALDNGGDN